MKQIRLALPEEPPSNYDYGKRSSGETHGVVLTRAPVVALILDLVGYTEDQDLGATTLLEPSCGHGAFLEEALRRLLRSATRHGRPLSSLKKAIHAFDIDPVHVEKTRSLLAKILREQGAAPKAATRLAEGWVDCQDFLLATIERRFDFVVGNPPYIRIEQLPPGLIARYREDHASLYDRADLYVAFIERGLKLLTPEGLLSYICADRWISNKYGGPLRALITGNHGVRCYINLHRASPFESEVIAYPSIFVLGKRSKAPTLVASLPFASEEVCRHASRVLRGQEESSPEFRVVCHDRWFQGDEAWVIGSPEHLAALRLLEERFPPIEASARIGIGVATGCDDVYIVGRGEDIEPDRCIPLVMREDLRNGKITDAGRFVINTTDDQGHQVNLERYPRLQHYLQRHEEAIRRRYVARKNPNAWFRTIDRITPALCSTPKLLIPDIAGANEVIFEQGRFYPHHNLYFITSERWDMEVLGGLLSSRVALFFVWSYAVKMRGGYLRFQAQYLRRIRLPDPASIPLALADALRDAFRQRDFPRLDELALEAYSLPSLPPFDFVDTRAR
jgi:hypothetical protein